MRSTCRCKRPCGLEPTGTPDLVQAESPEILSSEHHSHLGCPKPKYLCLSQPHTLSQEPRLVCCFLSSRSKFVLIIRVEHFITIRSVFSGGLAEGPGMEAMPVGPCGLPQLGGLQPGWTKGLPILAALPDFQSMATMCLTQQLVSCSHVQLSRKHV